MPVNFFHLGFIKENFFQLKDTFKNLYTLFIIRTLKAISSTAEANFLSTDGY